MENSASLTKSISRTLSRPCCATLGSTKTRPRPSDVSKRKPSAAGIRVRLRSWRQTKIRRRQPHASRLRSHRCSHRHRNDSSEKSSASGSTNALSKKSALIPLMRTINLPHRPANTEFPGRHAWNRREQIRTPRFATIEDENSSFRRELALACHGSNRGSTPTHSPPCL